MSQVQKEEEDRGGEVLSSTTKKFEMSPSHQYGQANLQQKKMVTVKEISRKTEASDAIRNIMIALVVLMMIQVVVIAAACIAFTLEFSNFKTSICLDSSSNLTDVVTRLNQLDDFIDTLSVELFKNVSVIGVQLQQQLNLSFSSQLISYLATQTQQLLNHLVERGAFPTFPANSCATLPPSTPSGYYWIRNTSGSSVYMYCDMYWSCGGVSGGWTRVAYLDGGYQCPNGLSQRNYSALYTCVKSHSSIGCSSGTIFPASYSYSEVCGYIIGHQKGQTDAFAQQLDDIDSFYVDGVSLTHGSPRQHIWTFAAARDETQETHLESKCPYILNNDTDFFNRPPSFVGDDYFCDTGSPNFSPTEFYSSKRLWAGLGCGSSSTCCAFNNPPFFYKQLSQPTIDDIEMRVCRNEAAMFEDIAITDIALYIR